MAPPPGIPRARSRLWHTGASGEGDSLQNAVEAFKVTPQLAAPHELRLLLFHMPDASAASGSVMAAYRSGAACDASWLKEVQKHRKTAPGIADCVYLMPLAACTL